MTDDSSKHSTYTIETEKRKDLKRTLGSPLRNLLETQEWKEAVVAMKKFDKNRPIKKTTEEDPS